MLYRCVSSKTTNVSLPPSFDALDAVDGVISPLPGSTVRVSPASRPGTADSGASSSVRLKKIVS
jgi:hypothetical protein